MKATIRKQLEKDLRIASARLLQLGRVVAIDQLPGDNSAAADELDGSQFTTSREIGWTTREMLVARVQRLTDALDRLRGGSYGICIECNQPLAPARLRALPEVQTCVGCQSSLELLDRQIGRSTGRERPFALTGTE